MKLFPTALVLLICSSLAGGSLVSAANAESQSRYVTVPVMYVTDRNATKKGYGPQRKVEDLRSIDNLHFGWLDYTLPTDHTAGGQQNQLGWRDSQKHPHPLFEATPLTDVKGYHDFGQVVIDAAKKAGTDDVFVVVHGFNTPFAAAAKEAALVAYNVQRPVILYSWPSKGKFGQYDVDLGNNEWSQEHFDELLDELKQVKDRSNIKFTLIAHSMGNRLVVHSAPVLKGKHIFKQIFLVDPDFDAETFVHYLLRYARNNDDATKAAALTNESETSEAIKPTRVRILFSHKDHALPLSEFLFGGYTRLGQAADTLLTTVVTPFSIPEKLSNAFGSASTKDGTKGDLGELPKWIMDFEWIDFTILDHGVIGHTVPYGLIASLWSTNEPGPGLKLVHSDNGSPNRLSSLFFHLFGEKDHISSKIDSSERVVRTTEK